MKYPHTLGVEERNGFTIETITFRMPLEDALALPRNEDRSLFNAISDMAVYMVVGDEELNKITENWGGINMVVLSDGL